MEITISNQLCMAVPHFQVGVIHYQNIVVDESPQMLKGKIQTFQESLFFDLEEKNVTDLEGIKEWRQVFKQTGKDPNRYRHSAEALHRRIKKQNFLSPVNSAIDINNFFSIKYQIPIGLYDTDKLSGGVTIRIGTETDEYVGLNGRNNSLNHLIISSDSISPFGSPFVDSERSAVTFETKNALHIVYLLPSQQEQEADQLIQSLMNMFLQIHGGNGSYQIIKC
ncbi:B3/B4 domain-containing protein [Bacillus massilinigeriensis]|uniref:B3/B4 domain-containing protein n=1 Tax=Bacillus massilionigeriensis TaxID=1805475 RepID=UPI00096B52FE|nr:phenylalanine--tRNA ligase beta subunit-related protein [Bacillus massilionigeriensis]